MVYCVCLLHVCIARINCICILHVCIVCMRTSYVCIVCAHCMCILYVHRMCIIHVYISCVCCMCILRVSLNLCIVASIIEWVYRTRILYVAYCLWVLCMPICISHVDSACVHCYKCRTSAFYVYIAWIYVMCILYVSTALVLCTRIFHINVAILHENHRRPLDSICLVFEWS